MDIGFIHIISYHQFLKSSYGRVGCFKKPLEGRMNCWDTGPTLVFGNRLTENHQWKAARNHPHQRPLYDGSPKVNTKGAWQEHGNGYITIQASIPKWQHSTPSVPVIQLNYLPISKVNTIASKLNSHVPWSKNRCSYAYCLLNTHLWEYCIILYNIAMSYPIIIPSYPLFFLPSYLRKHVPVPVPFKVKRTSVAVPGVSGAGPEQFFSMNLLMMMNVKPG